jgi:hypothetical protein
VSKLTTVTPTSPSFRHLPMPKFITNNNLHPIHPRQWKHCCGEV